MSASEQTPQKKRKIENSSQKTNKAPKQSSAKSDAASSQASAATTILFYYKGTVFPINTDSDKKEMIMNDADDMIALGIRTGVSIEEQKDDYLKQLDLIEKAFNDTAEKDKSINVESAEKAIIMLGFKSLNHCLAIWRLNICALLKMKAIPNDNNNGILETNTNNLYKGTESFLNGDVYEGAFKNGKFEGKGKLIRRNGDVYEGDFKDGELTGIGKMTYINGRMYEGQWKDGKFNGIGKLTSAMGNIYVGTFKEDVIIGEGKLTTKYGDIYEGGDIYYEGDIEMSKPIKITFANGNIYEGDVKDSLPNGKGKITFTNGGTYEGELKDGLSDGIGKESFSNGNVYEGDFSNGLSEGKGKLSFQNGDIYKGDFRNGSANGKGKLTTVNGDIFEGNLRDGKPDGKGKWTYLESEIFATGDFYEGFCEDPKYYNKDGKRMESRGPIGKMTEANVTSMNISSELLIDEDTRKRKAENMLSPKDQRKLDKKNRTPPKKNSCKECDSDTQCFPPVEKRGSDYADHKKFVAAEKSFYKKHPLRKIKDKK